jgi:site-specific DNA recombinase
LLKQRLNRIQDGWEKGVYTEVEAVAKVKELRQLIANAEQEIENINAMYKRENFNLDSLRQELLSLRSQNLEEASFEEKAELIARLGVKVIPAEDLKTRRICCRLNMNNTQKKGGEKCLTKVTFGGAGGIRTPYLLTASQTFSQLNYSPTIK